MTLVGDAAKEAAFTFGHNHGVPCLVTADVGLTLDRRKTLWEAGALPGTRLDLVMIAGY
jgi:hypothetical protein